MKNQKGFTLVEILVSIFILMLLSMVFFQFFIMSQKTTTENKQTLVAANLAQSVLEEIKTRNSASSEEPNYCTEVVSKGTYGSTVCSLNSEELIPFTELPEELAMRTIEGRNYYIVIIVSDEHEMDLYPVEVKVCCENGNIKASVKGLVQL